MNNYIVDPAKVMLVTPSHDGNVCAGYAGGLISTMSRIGGYSFVNGCSHIALARNLQAQTFLRATQFDWLLSIDADMGFSLSDLQLLYKGDEQIRVAEYAKKDFVSDSVNKFGFGFVLIHRSVFVAIEDVELASNPGVKVAQQFFWKGELIHDYFMSGATPEGHWLGEDHGFFTLARLANASVKVVQNASLVHWGRHGFTTREFYEIEKRNNPFV